MTLSRVRAETTMILRLKRYMVAAQMGITFVGTNTDLNDPLATALAQMGAPAVDPLAVTDADVAGIAALREVEYLDRVELRLLKNILGNLPDTDMSTGGKSEARNQLPERVRNMILDKEKQIALQYGEPDDSGNPAGSTSLTGGAARIVFQDNYEDYEY